MPRYWFVDFARAEHPRIYTLDQQKQQRQRQQQEELQQFCPFNCTASLAAASTNISTNPTPAQCAEVLKVYPTLLGVDPWSCYWEWVWQGLGDQAYMHRPTLWGQIQFEDQKGAAVCKNIEHPGRCARDIDDSFTSFLA